MMVVELCDYNLCGCCSNALDPMNRTFDKFKVGLTPWSSNRHDHPGDQNANSKSQSNAQRKPLIFVRINFVVLWKRRHIVGAVTSTLNTKRRSTKIWISRKRRFSKGCHLASNRNPSGEVIIGHVQTT